MSIGSQLKKMAKALETVTAEDLKENKTDKKAVRGPAVDVPDHIISEVNGVQFVWVDRGEVIEIFAPASKTISNV